MAPKPKSRKKKSQQPSWRLPVIIMTSSALILAVSVAIGVSPWTALAQGSPAVRPLPKNAQIIDQRSFNVLEEVKPPLEANATTVCHLPFHEADALANTAQEFLWPGVTRESLREKPFHVFDPEFYDVIGSDPSLTLIAESDFDPIFHEAVTW
jgi:gluconolactonase